MTLGHPFPRRTVNLSLFATSVLTLASMCLGQVPVSQNYSKQVYVNDSIGFDSSQGTQSEPVKTLSRAVAIAESESANGIATAVIIAPGTYRESVSLNQSSSTAGTIAFQAATPGTVQISGSEVISGWSSRQGGVYVHLAPTSFGLCAHPAGWPGGIPNIVLHREMVFVNGVALTQVLSKTQLYSGTFYATPSDIYIKPPSGTDMATAKVEFATRPVALSITGRSNIVLRGLTFEHTNGCLNGDSAVEISNSQNILIDNDQFNWNNWGGLSISSSNKITVQNSTANFNGGVGMQAFENTSTFFQSNTTEYNNWRGAMGALYDWAMGGTKLMRMHGVQVKNHTSALNHAQGLWFDTDDTNVSVDSAHLIGNRLANFQTEANQGPMTISNSVLCYGGLGIELVDTAGFKLSNDKFYSNGGVKYSAEIFLAGNPGGRYVTNWQTGRTTLVHTENSNFAGNAIINARSGQWVFATYLSGSEWSHFASTLSSNYNTWYDSTKSTAFVLPSNNTVTLRGWRSDVNADWNSSWSPAHVASSCGVAGPSKPDYINYVDQRYQSVGRGRSTSYTMTLVPFGFSGTVSFSVAGLPSGSRGSFSKGSLNSSGSNKLTISTSSSTPYGTYNVTIFATTGNMTRAVTVTLHVS